MNETSKGLMYWTPRVLCIAFAALLAAFAADVFDMPLNVWEKAIALAMHLVPSLMVLVVLAVAWRHEWIAAMLFPAARSGPSGVEMGPAPLDGVCLYRGTLLLLGVLYLVSWPSRAALKPSVE